MASSSLKRTASSSSQGNSSEKKQKTGSKPLDGWLSISLPRKPHPIGISDPLQDQDSTFLAWAAQAESTQDIQKLRNYVLEVANPDFSDEPASHTAHGAVSQSIAASCSKVIDLCRRQQSWRAENKDSWLKNINQEHADSSALSI